MKATIALKKISLDPTAKITDILRHAFAIAENLDLQDFKIWCECELKGYYNTADANLPNYRLVEGTLHAMNISNGNQHFLISDSIGQQIKEGIIFFQESLSKNQNSFDFTFPSDVQRTLKQKIKYNSDQYILFQKVDRISLEKVVDIVRTKILEFAIELEKKEIFGEEWEFTNEEKKLTQNIHYHNLINNGNMSNHNENSTISQKSTNNVSVIKGDFDSLASNLKSHGIKESDILELQTILDATPLPQSPSEYSSDLKGWMKKMISNSIEGSWQVAVGAAGGILATSIQNYFG